MPISPSPIVQGYMAQGQDDQSEPMSADKMFEKTFGDSAFAQVRARFPELVGSIVTFKVLDSDVQTGKAFGTFIVRSGNDIRFLPVVMSDGSVTSCELIYDKRSDTFTPLSQDTVRRLLSGNLTGDGSILSGDVHVDDTNDLFRSMVRPPASSNVVLASSEDGIESLPPAAKDKVREWLLENPETLAHIASVSDVEELAGKLANKHAPSDDGEEGVRVIDLKTASSDDVAGLTDEEQSKLLRDGYLIKVSSEAPAESVVAPVADFKASIETELGLEQYAYELVNTDRTVRSARAASIEVGDFVYHRCSITRHGVFFDGGKHLDGDAVRNIILRDLDAAKDRDCLISCGALTADKLARQSIPCGTRVVPVVTARNGDFIEVSQGTQDFICTDVTHSRIDDDLFIRINGHTEFHVTKDISHGSINSGHTVHLPKDVLFFVLDHEHAGCPGGLIRSWDELCLWMSRRGRQLRVLNDGPTTEITDSRTSKTAKFLSKTAAARWLNESFGLNHEQARSVLGNHVSFVFDKTAFDQQPQINPNTGMQVPVAQPQYAMPAQPQVLGMPMATTAPMTPGMQPQFNPAAIQTAAQLGDPDAIDTGILASFAQDPDIKQLLVDYLPDFQSVLDKLGRLILLFSIEKSGLEEFYGSERYANTLGSCRKMMKLLGDTVEQLQRYIGMA